MFTLMAKPVGGVCNLRCSYCYYLEKVRLYPGSNHRMSEEVLEEMVRGLLRRGFPVAPFSWQGGEPMLRGLDFYRLAADLQRRYARPPVEIRNAFQTNGILLTAEWCEFLRENGFLVGLSIDGPRKVHDVIRVDSQGRGSHDRALSAMKLLISSGTEWNVLVVVGDHNVDVPEEVYGFLVDAGARHIQFIPCLNLDEDGKPGRGSTGAEAYGDFLVRVFDLWSRNDADRVHIQAFDSILETLVLGRPTLCIFSERCGRNLIVEHTGDIYACDHFVVPEWRTGNLLRTPIEHLAYGEHQDRFEARKGDLCPTCRRCEWRIFCNGGCPKHRILEDGSGWPLLSYFCTSYRMLFERAVPDLRRMAADRYGPLDPARPAPRRDPKAARVPLPSEGKPRPGRNDPCPCGSGRKWKHCCGKT